MDMEATVLLAVSAEVLFHDGTNWQRVDNANGIQNSTGLSTIQLIKANQESHSTYRIIAFRSMDNQRIVDQTIFHRLKYKEATPSFHQWRNEHKQVIGLNFPNEQDARHFYAAVRQSLESVVNMQQHISASSVTKPHQQTENVTYQDPQNFHYHHPHHNNSYHQQNQDIYANQDNAIYNNNNEMAMALKMNGHVDHGTQRLAPSRAPIIPYQQQHQQQQQNLMRRASQGSNISSSTGGSLPGPNYGQAMPPSVNNQISHEMTNCHYAPLPSHLETQPPSSQIAQHTVQLQDNKPSQAHHQNDISGPNTSVPKAPINSASAPPPPPPPPPDLKNILSASKQQSFADQLRHVQLRKNSTGVEKGQIAKSSPPASNSNSTTSNGGGVGPSSKTGNQQDLISELADRLNRRKMNVNEGTAGTQTQVRPLPQAPTPNLAKIAPAHPVNCHKKIPSGSSLSSQEEAHSTTNGVIMGGINNQNHQTAGATTVNSVDENGMKRPNAGGTVTAEDLAQLKNELTEAFTDELNKLKVEMTQTIRNEIAKLINQK